MNVKEHKIYITPIGRIKDCIETTQALINLMYRMRDSLYVTFLIIFFILYTRLTSNKHKE